MENQSRQVRERLRSSTATADDIPVPAAPPAAACPSGTSRHSVAGQRAARTGEDHGNGRRVVRKPLMRCEPLLVSYEHAINTVERKDLPADDLAGMATAQTPSQVNRYPDLWFA